MSRGIRINVSVGRDVGGRTWLQVARDAEAIGFHELRVADHFVAGLHAPFAALAAAAAATHTLRVGTYVLNNDFRHPLDVAREAATIADISGGRFTLGIGAGHMRAEYDEAGLVFDPAGVRVDRMTESVGLLRRLLAGGRVTEQGAHYRIDHELRLEGAAPVALLVGGNGTRVLRVGARYADVIGLTGFSPRGDGTDSDMRHFSEIGLAERLVVVRTAVAASPTPRAMPDLDVLVQFVEVTDRPDVALDRLSGRTDLPVEVLRSSPFVLVGTVDEIVAKILDLHDRMGITAFTVFGERARGEQELTTMAPVIERLAQIG